MDKHIKIISILFIVLGGLGFLGGFLLFILYIGAGFFAGSTTSEPEFVLAAGIMGTILLTLLLITSLPAVIAGIGMLKRKSWARILGIIVAILSLPAFPFGTIMGIYALWVLFKEETATIFESRQPEVMA